MNALLSGGTFSGTNTGDQFTDTTASTLLGRGSADGDGAAEEVTLGAGLSMTGTVLAATSGFDVTDAASDPSTWVVLARSQTGVQSPTTDSGLAYDASSATLVSTNFQGQAVSMAAEVHAYSATAVPAGGTTGKGLKLSSTANLGVFFGSGAPSLSAAKGSLYLRTDGSGTSNRMYVNTDGATTWTAVTTAA